jgi:predicted O-methyltransferase YrrM
MERFANGLQTLHKKRRTRACAETLDAEMTFPEQEFLQKLILHENSPGAHLEIGTAAGGTLCRMMKCFSDETRPPFVVVDRMTYFPDQQQTVIENLKRNGLSANQVDFRTTTSSTAFRRANRRKESFDFMLIDASHKILAVMADLRWTRLLNVGGVVCFHDYSDKFPGVKLAVDRFLKHHPNYEPVGLVESLLALRKAAPCPSKEVSLFDSVYSVMMYLPLEVDRKINKWKTSKCKSA